MIPVEAFLSSNNVLFVAIHFIPFFIAVAVAAVARLNIQPFILLMVILTGLKISISYLVFDSTAIFLPSITFVVGILLFIVSAGLLGNKMSRVDYRVLISMFTMFPWYLGWKASLVFIAATSIVTVVYAFFAYSRGAKKMNVKRMTPAQARIHLGEEGWKNLISESSVSFAIPVLIGGFISGISMMLT